MSLVRFAINGTPGSPPPSGYLYLYMKSDNLLYFMDDTGAELPVRPVGGGTGDLLSDGTVPLTADWNVGLYKLIANQFQSVIASGTAPLIVASNTLVANLNADLLDGYEPAAFLLQAATTLAGTGFFLDEDNMASNDDTKVPSQQSVKAYVDNAVTGLFDDKGNYDASTNTPDLDTTPIAGILKGDVYTVSVAGDFFTIAVEPGDTIRALQDAPTLESHWAVVQANLVNAIVDADYSGTVGLQHKDSAGTYRVIKTNLNASTDPTTTDDASAGYDTWSLWANTTASPHKVFLCRNPAVGAADWIQVGVGGLSASVKTAAYTILTSEDVGVDSSGGAFDVTLKASPSAGDVAVIHDVGGAANTYNVGILRNGSTINGVAADENLNVDYGVYWFIFDGTTWNFTPIVPGGLSQTQVDARVTAVAGNPVHIDVAAEVSAMTLKSHCTLNDSIMLEDSEDSYNKKEGRLGHSVPLVTNTGNIADDNVWSLDFGAEAYAGTLIIGDNSGTNYGVIAFRCATTGPFCNVIAATGIGATTGILTGTTGTDGQVNVSTHTDQKLYIENRSGGARNFCLTIAWHNS